jgi:hypothetical protein
MNVSFHSKHLCYPWYPQEILFLLCHVHLFAMADDSSPERGSVSENPTLRRSPRIEAAVRREEAEAAVRHEQAHAARAGRLAGRGAGCGAGRGAGRGPRRGSGPRFSVTELEFLLECIAASCDPKNGRKQSGKDFEGFVVLSFSSSHPFHVIVFVASSYNVVSSFLSPSSSRRLRHLVIFVVSSFSSSRHFCRPVIFDVSNFCHLVVFVVSLFSSFHHFRHLMVFVIS